MIHRFFLVRWPDGRVSCETWDGIAIRHLPECPAYRAVNRVGRWDFGPCADRDAAFLLAYEIIYAMMPEAVGVPLIVPRFATTMLMQIMGDSWELEGVAVTAWGAGFATGLGVARSFRLELRN